jgi:hypothetical protein
MKTDGGDGSEADATDIWADGAMSVEEVQKLTTQSKTQVHALCNSKALISSKRGRRRLIARRSVLEWLARGVAK